MIYKKIAAAVLTLAAVVSTANAQAEYAVEYDGKSMALSTLTDDDGGVMFPLRKVAEMLSAEVGWDGENRIVTVSTGSDVCKIPLGAGMMYKNKFRYDLAVPATLIDDTTYVGGEVLRLVLGVSADDERKIISAAENTATHGDNSTISVIPTADTYVCGGVNSGTNYGGEEYVGFLNTPDEPDMNQMGYIKFDISGIDPEGLENVYFRCKVKKNEKLFQSSWKPVKLNMYDVEPGAWDESTLTYDNQPERGEYIAQGQAFFGYAGVDTAVDGADITDYIKNKIAEGKIEFSFMWEGSREQLQGAYMFSRENPDITKIARLEFVYHSPEVKDLEQYEPTWYGNGVKPIEQARKMIDGTTAVYGT